MNHEFYRNWQTNVLTPFARIRDDRPGTAIEMLGQRIGTILRDKERGNYDGSDALMYQSYSAGLAFAHLLNNDKASARRQLDQIDSRFPAYQDIIRFINDGYTANDVKNANHRLLTNLDSFGKELASRM